jgi:hypothetical protein
MEPKTKWMPQVRFHTARHLSKKLVPNKIWTPYVSYFALIEAMGRKIESRQGGSVKRKQRMKEKNNRNKILLCSIERKTNLKVYIEAF